MLEYIIFTDNNFAPLTKETAPEFKQLSVVLCQGSALVEKIAHEIADTVNGEREQNTYWCNDADVGNAVLTRNGQNVIVRINEQQIIISCDPNDAKVAQDYKDVILIGERQNKYAVQMLCDYEHYISRQYGSDPEKVYRALADGRFGLFQNGRPLPCAIK